jgi:hypothetical protein
MQRVSIDKVHRLIVHCCCRCLSHTCTDASVSPDGTMASAGVWHLTNPAAAAGPADEQLTEKLLPLAVGLYRCEALAPTLQQYKGNAGEEVKEAVREVVQQVLPVLLSACGDSLPLQGGGGAGEVYAWEQLQVGGGCTEGVLCWVAGRLVVMLRVGSALQLRVRAIQVM